VKKWVFTIVLVGMLTWTLYDFVIKEDSDSSDEAVESLAKKNQNEQTDSLPANSKGRQDKDKETEPTPKTGLGYGDLAPNFELETLEGEKRKLSDFRGEPVMINFWATWCPPCKAEMPDMERFYKDHKVTIFSVNLTQQESNQKTVEKFVDTYDLTFPIMLDKQIDVADTYLVQTIPTTYILDSEGKVFHKMIGPMNYDDMVAKFEEAKQETNDNQKKE